MSRYEITVEPRGEGEPLRFEVNTRIDPLRYGQNAEDVARIVAREYPDSGSIVVRRIGGGERAVVARG